jgi:sugar phosphate isomerase/epimerase
MLYGGHVKSPDDILFLKQFGFPRGEVVLRDAPCREFWKNSGIKNDVDSGFLLIAHGPQEGPPNDISHLWQVYYPALLETVDVAATMQIELLTVHLWMDPRFVKQEVREEKETVLRVLFDYARARNILICLENLSECSTDLAAVVRAVPKIGITLDVGHGELLTQMNTSVAIIRELMQSIKHLHLHDNRGGRGVKDDLHLPIGEGIIDFESILGSLLLQGYCGTATLEVEREALVQSRERIRAMTERVGRATDSFTPRMAHLPLPT